MQELQTQSSVTLNCQVTKIVIVILIVIVIVITWISCASSKTTSRKGTVGDFTGRNTGVSEREHLMMIMIVNLIMTNDKLGEAPGFSPNQQGQKTELIRMKTPPVCWR